MSARFEKFSVPEEYDREWFMAVFNNHAQAIGKLANQNDALVDKINRTAQVVWHIVQKVCPDEARVVMDEMAEELDMKERIDELFRDLEGEEVDEEVEDGE